MIAFTAHILHTPVDVVEAWPKWKIKAYYDEAVKIYKLPPGSEVPVVLVGIATEK